MTEKYGWYYWYFDEDTKLRCKKCGHIFGKGETAHVYATENSVIEGLYCQKCKEIKEND